MAKELRQLRPDGPVVRMGTPLLTAADVQELEELAREAGFQLLGVELCDDPACLEHDQGDD